jgi:hypothetical protein
MAPGALPTCFAVTLGEARELRDILDQAGLERDEWMAPYLLGYHLGVPQAPDDRVIWFGPVLPHGQWIVSGGG